MGRPRDWEITLTEIERQSLTECVRSRSAPHGLVRRSRIVLASASGHSNTEIARELGVSVPCVCLWRNRFLAQGLVGLYGEQRPGRPRSHDDEAVAALLNRVLQSRPASGTHWTVRGASAATGIPKSTVQRYFRLFGVQPHRTRGFKLSTDPLFVEKVRDIVGLYLSPPEHAVVLCVDEKSKIQALERTQPVLPMGLGYADGLTHDYKRHGTTTLFAALDIANGQVITQCKARHRHQEFLGFLKQIDASVPSGLDVHLVVDNYGPHKHPRTRAWLARHPRFHFHFTPTYASWLNQVERWFGILTQQEIRRGSFASTRQLIDRIDTFVINYNISAQPFVWTATADEILRKVAAICKVINGTRH